MPSETNTAAEQSIADMRANFSDTLRDLRAFGDDLAAAPPVLTVRRLNELEKALATPARMTGVDEPVVVVRADSLAALLAEAGYLKPPQDVPGEGDAPGD